MFELPSFTVTISLLSLLVFLFYSLSLLSKRTNASYPPSPTPKPIIGNALDIPFKGKPWLQYMEWSKRLHSKFLGDIVHMSAVNIHIVVLHTMEDVTALLEKRSAIYSDRPVFPVATILGLDFVTPTMPYNDRWKCHRTIHQETLRKDRVPFYRHLVAKKVHLFLGELLKDPSSFSEQCKWLAASFTLDLTYGYQVDPDQKNDRFMQAADLAVQTGGELSLPGATMLNIIPSLCRIPPWVPGAYTQRLAARIKQTITQYKTELFMYTKNNMATGASSDCILAELLQRCTEEDDGLYNDRTLLDVSATLYIGAFHGLPKIVILAMALHPECQKKAQMEIDRVVGSDKLPTYEDRPSLLYIEALCREVQRWRPTFPLGVPHSAIKDDTYKGFYIPKGTFVMPNVWAITRDEARYHDPELFMPERFFNADGTLNQDTVGYVFGFGRRICVGRHIADSVLWLMVSCMLATFDISKAKDDNGHEIDIDPDAFADSLIT
ncbi:Cytochrome P450 [Amanita muscaria]